jgi:hypothetical protein
MRIFQFLFSRNLKDLFTATYKESIFLLFLGALISNIMLLIFDILDRMNQFSNYFSSYFFSDLLDYSQFAINIQAFMFAILIVLCLIASLFAWLFLNLTNINNLKSAEIISCSSHVVFFALICLIASCWGAMVTSKLCALFLGNNSFYYHLAKMIHNFLSSTCLHMIYIPVATLIISCFLCIKKAKLTLANYEPGLNNRWFIY